MHRVYSCYQGGSRGWWWVTVNGMAGAAECVSGARDATCARLIATTLISMFGAGSVTGRSKFVRPAAVACSRSLRLLCNEPCKHRLFLRAQTSGCSGSVGCVRGARAYLGPLFCTSLSRVRHTYQHHPFYEHTLEYPKIDRSIDTNLHFTKSVPPAAGAPLPAVGYFRLRAP